MGVRRKYIRSLAEHLLDEYNIQAAPVNVDEIIQDLGAELCLEQAPDQLSGFFYRDANGNAIIGANQSHHSNRQRFTMAHELGHMILHPGEPVHWDGLQFGIRFRRERRDDEAPSDDEVEANVFAAELLMPARFLERDLAEFDDEDFDVDVFEERVLERLANRYKVSKQAMSIRLQNLGYIVADM